MHIAIIGNGVTGVAAAKRIRQIQPDWKISLISGESNYHYSRPALMYIFMGHMSFKDTKPYQDHFWEINKIDLVRAWVTQIDHQNNRLILHGKKPIEYDKLLIATGSKSNKFGWPGQDLEGVQGLMDLMDLRVLYKNVENAKRAVIVGGGLIGIELAEMIHSRNLEVTFLVREGTYWGNVLPKEESMMINRIIRHEGLDLRLQTELKEIIDDGNGRVGAVVTNEDERIDCEIVGLTAGVSPNTDLVRESDIDTGRGILVDWSFKTNVPDIFAAGDCAELVTEDEQRNVIQQVWYTGKMQGKVAGEVIAGKESTYDPGIWYNSAKFFDLEYQTYGKVSSVPVEGENNLFWEHPNNQHAMRIITKENIVIGINVMGLRYRHKVCENWIRENRTLDFVLDNLQEANFDPEFCDKFEQEIRHTFREKAA